MPNSPQIRGFDSVSVPLAVARKGVVVHVNGAFTTTFGPSAEAVVGAQVTEVFRELGGADAVARLQFNAPRPPGGWFRWADGQGVEHLVRIRSAPGPGPDEFTYVFAEQSEEEHVRVLTDMLVRAATQLMACRSEAAVLELAADGLHQAGFAVTILLRRGDNQLHHATLRHEPGPLAAAERLYGRPMLDVVLDLNAFPQAQRVFGEGRANFTQDVFAVLERIHAPEVVTMMRTAFPHSRAVDAPIPIEGVPYGMLSIFGDALTPGAAGVIELFGRMLGAAIENARNHERLESQLARVTSLQEELVARERLAVVGEAAGVLAHEIRNPLGVILNGVAILRHEPVGRSERASFALNMVEEELTRLDSLVRDVLHASRPMELAPVACEIDALLRQQVPLIWAKLQSSQLSLSLSIDPGPARITADECLLQLALGKLLENAVQASPAGSTVGVLLERHADCWLLAVEDEGPSVAESDNARLFRPFFTARNAGTGLGLTVVQRVALAHGATVRARRREQAGMRFEVVFPDSATLAIAG